MQGEVNAQGIFRQVRAALSVILYSCVYAINALRMTLGGSDVYKNICLSLELRAPCSSRLIDVFYASVLSGPSPMPYLSFFSGESAPFIYPSGR